MFRVPDSRELLRWILIAVCWFDLVIDYRLNRLEMSSAKDT